MYRSRLRLSIPRYFTPIALYTTCAQMVTVVGQTKSTILTKVDVLWRSFSNSSLGQCAKIRDYPYNTVEESILRFDDLPGR